MVAFGPHTEGGNHNFLTELLDTFEFTAILSGHNHNLQWVPKHGGWKVPQITVGSSAKLSPTTIDKTGGNGWSHDKSGGFGHLTITRTGATFEFVDENGNSLKTVQLARRASA
ncbi:hypothetical protein RF11_15007 [Thelohanellus kitauei]|uniref:Uncharacterized protein n=1 Tax=Thelohanellus kitauei TaxID=669202 RepID=A0A0C2IEQ0_THEKT|nr:hypothetical protein RF11_15007 [Thelohanellus kitauei]